MPSKLRSPETMRLQTRCPPPHTCKNGVCAKEEIIHWVYATVYVPVSRTAQKIQCSESAVVIFNNKKKNHWFSVINKQYRIFINGNKHIIWAYLKYTLTNVSVNRWSFLDWCCCYWIWVVTRRTGGHALPWKMDCLLFLRAAVLLVTAKCDLLPLLTCTA